jgi:hypothetical protein
MEQSVLSSLTIRWLVTHESTESIGMSDRRLEPAPAFLEEGVPSPDLLLSRDSDGIHTHPRGQEANASSLRNHARVSGTLHRTVSQSQCSTGVNRRKLRESEETNRTLTDRKSVWTRPPRRETPQPENQTQVSPPFAQASSRARRSDRRGQAPKGAGGMPRRHQDSGVEGCEKSGGAAQRASSPEYPRRPRELKHLSTWRKGNQPRLPQ